MEQNQAPPEFQRIYHHTRWTGRHEMVLITPKKVLVNTNQGQQLVDQPGLSVVFNRGTYQCNDPKIATMIEKDREFKQHIIIALPDPEEFKEQAVAAKMAGKMTGVPMHQRLNDAVKEMAHAPMEVPKQAVPQPVPVPHQHVPAQPHAPAPQQPVQETKSSDLERLIQAANVLAGAMNQAVAAMTQQVQPAPIQQQEVVPEQTQEPTAPPQLVSITPAEVPPGLVEQGPAGVDGEIPFVKRQPMERETQRATDQKWQGTPKPANANAVKETGEFAHVVPSGGDGIMRPTQQSMVQAMDTGMPEIEELVNQGKDIDQYLGGTGEAFGEGPANPIPQEVSPTLSKMVQGGQPNEAPIDTGPKEGIPPVKLEMPGQDPIQTVPELRVQEPVAGVATPELRTPVQAPTGPTQPVAGVPGHQPQLQAGPSEVDPEAVIAESRTVAAQLKGQSIEKKPSKDADGKRLIYCSICGAGPYRSGRSVGSHRQEQHPETYAAKKK